MNWTDSLDSRYEGAVGAPTDLTEMCDIATRSDMAVRGSTFVSVDFLDTIMNEPGFDRTTDVVTVTERTTGKLSAFGRFMKREPFVMSDLGASVDPDHQGRGIGGCIVDWGVQRAEDALGRAPEGARVITTMATNDGDNRAKRLFVSKGFQAERYFLEMDIALISPIEVPPLPEGITLRALRHDEDIVDLSAAVEETFKDHYGHTESSPDVAAARWRNWRSSEAWDDDLVWLAEKDGRIVGMNVCITEYGSRTNYGYVATLGVLREARGMGLARSMLTTSFAEYQRRGKDMVALHVDADNISGATRLYTGVGMHEVQRDIDYERELRPGKDLVVR